jgi:hypothetical protein
MHPVSPIVIALTYAVVGVAVIPIGFALFRTPYKLWEVVLAAPSERRYLYVPTIGGIASLAGTFFVLYWRLGRSFTTEIVVSVGVARLVMLPVLLILSRT